MVGKKVGQMNELFVEIRKKTKRIELRGNEKKLKYIYLCKKTITQRYILAKLNKGRIKYLNGYQF